MSQFGYIKSSNNRIFSDTRLNIQKKSRYLTNFNLTMFKFRIQTKIKLRSKLRKQKLITFHVTKFKTYIKKSKSQKFSYLTAYVLKIDIFSHFITKVYGCTSIKIFKFIRIFSDTGKYNMLYLPASYLIQQEGIGRKIAK